MKKYYFEHENLDLSHLKAWEIELIDILKRTVEITGEIYDRQINSAAGFYPSGTSIDEIEEAAVSDPSILSPFSRVIREDGKLKAVYYYDEYADEIKEICKILESASQIYMRENYKNYAEYLKALCSDLCKANFDNSEKLWLKLNGSAKVDIKLGAFETYMDKLLGVKKSFQANLRITDEVEDKNLKDYIEVINAILPASPFAKDISESDFIVRIDKVVAMGGWHADLIPRSSNYPSDSSLMKYGVKALIYTNNIAKKQPLINDIATTIIDSSLADPEKLSHATVKTIIFHEISETISKLKYSKGYEELGNYRDLIVESYANLMGIKSGAVQVLKGVLSLEEYQYILVAYTASSLRGWFQGKLNPAVSTYSDGYRLALNYFLEKEAIKIYGNRIQIDYPRMYSALDTLTTLLIQIIMNGNSREAQNLFAKYSNEKELNKFDPVLRNILTQPR